MKEAAFFIFVLILVAAFWGEPNMGDILYDRVKEGCPLLEGCKQ